MYVKANSLIIISHLLELVCLCPKAIPLSNFHSSLRKLIFIKIRNTQPTLIRLSMQGTIESVYLLKRWKTEVIEEF
jgi:hypothetical protein